MMFSKSNNDDSNNDDNKNDQSEMPEDKLIDSNDNPVNDRASS